MVEALPSKADFAAQTDTAFEVATGNGAPLRLQLVALEDGRSTEQQEQFSLTFHAPAEMPPAQATYRVEHPALGSMDLFLVPVAREGDVLVLEAVFNRFLDTTEE